LLPRRQRAIIPAISWRPPLGAPHAHPPVKLLIALLTSDLQIMEEVERRLCAAYGAIEDRTEIFLFTFPGPFQREMGENLKKRIICFETLLPIEQLPEVKKFTNDLEWEYREHLQERSRRVINLDPGYLTLSKVLLASTRNYSHHVYLKDGVYGELLLRFHRGALRNLPWTYADYRSHLAHSFFTKVRERYHTQLKSRFAHRRES
jgi:uncharacterized protein DUF4416